MYVEIDANGRIEFANALICQQTGYSASDLVGADVRTLIVEEDGEGPPDKETPLPEREGSWRRTIRIRTRFGDEFHASATGIVHRDEVGTLLRTAVVCSDNTDQVLTERALGETLRFARGTVDALSAHIAIIDEHGTILDVNRAWREFAESNGSASPHVGSNYLEVCRCAAGADRSTAQSVIEGIVSVINGEIRSYVEEYDCHGPEELRWFTMHVTRFPGEGPIRVVIAHENTTSSRLAREKLSDQARELAVAQQAAEAASRAKSEFLATISHEIRTPLNGIIGTLELLESTSMTDRQMQYVHVGRTSSQALLTLINDVLDFSKIEAGRLELHTVEFSLRDLIEDVMAMMIVRASGQHLELICTIDVDIPKIVRADPDRIRQVLVNLIGNAIKFTPKGSVCVYADRTGEDSKTGTVSVRFRIVDTGIGIPSEHQERIFSPFDQFDVSTTRRYGGTGLGLAISRNLAVMMGGNIGVVSSPGEGSEFWFEVPIRRSIVKAAPSGSIEAIEAVDPSRRILLVEDHDAQRRSIVQYLNDMGFCADSASDGEQGIRFMLEADSMGTPYSLLIVDDELPGMNGLEVVRALRSNASLQHTPVILISSKLDIDVNELSPMVSEQLTKPMRYSTLRSTIRRLLTTRSDESTTSPSSSLESPIAIDHSPESTICSESVEAKSIRPRVLIAEDNEVNQLIISELLTAEGFDCTIACNGRAAVQAFIMGRFDVILMDCQMPEMDGFDAAREIRRVEAFGCRVRTPIIAVTANAMDGDRERCFQMGMDEYIAKPIDIGSLLRIIESFRPDSWPHERERIA